MPTVRRRGRWRRAMRGNVSRRACGATPRAAPGTGGSSGSSAAAAPHSCAWASAGSGGPSYGGRSARATETSWVTPGSPVSMERTGTPAAARSRNSSPGIRSGASARNAARCVTGSSTGKPSSPPNAGRRTASRSSPCAAMSVVTVSASTHARRAGQTSAASVSATRRSAASQPPAIWPTGPSAGATGSTSVAWRVRERRADRAVGVEGADDDRGRAARPGDVGQAADRGRAVGVREGGCRGRGQDDGGDGHGFSSCTAGV